ncbi:MAG: hypothetical protein KAV82_05260 [Phycisphaerae bacterium]|nr:hypothetical protein [Phycisphaerae bacterium]
MSETMQKPSGASLWVSLRLLGVVSIMALGLIAMAGCSQHAAESGWGNPGKVQVLFYSPPGAEIAVKSVFDQRYQQITTDETLEHRLELTPEEYAVFNFSPGKYQFCYSTAPGFPGVNVYGELEVHGSCNCEVRKFLRGALIPVKLPSRYYLNSRPLHPTTGPSAAGLNEIEVDQLAQGDLIEKVYFIADLDTVYDDIRRINIRLDKLRSAEVVLNSTMEYLDARHEDYRRDSIYADPTYSIDDATKEFWGTDRKFNKIEAKRQRLEHKRYAIHEQIEHLVRERRIRRTLLDSMRIINRSGALVLASPEYQWPYHDTFDQVAHSRTYNGFTVGPGCNYHLCSFKLHPLGRVVAVMRVGGRHKHWEGLPTAVADRDDTDYDITTVEYREETRSRDVGTVVE